MEELRHEEQELVICMMSDVKGHFLGDKILTRGTATGSLVTPREIFMEALRRHAVSLILIHIIQVVILHQVRMTYRLQPGFIRRGNCWEYICWIIL